MRLFNLKWTRWGLMLLLLAMVSAMPLSATPSVAAQSPGPAVGIVCTSGTGSNPTFTLTTKDGYISLPDGNTAYMWGYSEGGNGFQHPGPVLCVNQGDTVTVVLNNTLPQPVSIMFPGQENVLANGQPVQPDLAAAIPSLTTAAAANNGSVTYSFVANSPGTFLYESGTNGQIQVRMGLFGALLFIQAMSTIQTH